MGEPKRFSKGRHVYTKWDKNTKEVRVMSEKPLDQPERPQLNVEIDDVAAQGVYSNLASISYNENEFVLDFLFLQPQTPKARVRSRVITSPQHAKKILQVLSQNLSEYERKFRAL